MNIRAKFQTIAICAASLAAALAQAATPINLLPLGDSITSQGYYVNPLLNTLSNNGYAPTLIANEGHSGYIIDGSIAGAPRAGLRENIGTGGDFLDHPNVNAANTYILLMIGTNDVDTGFQLSTAQVQGRMGGLISAIRTDAPLAHLIVAKIVPNLGSPAEDAAVQQFNTDISTVAVGTNVSLVDMYSAIMANSAAYMGDSLHPNQAGGDQMANVWFYGIEAIQVPEPCTLTMLSCGVIALWLVRRKRK